jgi:hypothetical protein
VRVGAFAGAGEHELIVVERLHRLLDSRFVGAPDVPEVRPTVGTVRPDGPPHAAAIGAAWYDGDLCLQCGPNTRKARNIAPNPACTVSGSLPGMDLVFEGEAGASLGVAKVLEPARSSLARGETG